ncbi:MAG: MFS transporter [Candidatus Hodarchaeaceae archaeon]|nr:MFS transporter [Candidatus Hodarchaeaceae archaeon]
MRMRRRGLLFGLGFNIIVLGIASFLTDVSTEMILPLFPLFTTEVLLASPAALGLIEGMAESAASLLKVASGWWSDRAGRRKPFVVSGYGLSTAVKPMLALATSWPHALGGRFADRVGKGIRTAPRDAIIADSSEANVRGKAFGLHRMLDTLGAVLGPALAFLLLPLLGYRRVFLAATVPAVIAVLVLTLFVREARRGRAIGTSFKAGVGSLSPEFRLYAAIATLFALGNFSWAFLILRAREMGIAAEHAILLYMFHNLVYALVSLPAGVLSDRAGRRPVIALGYGIFGLTCVGFALATSAWHGLLLFAAYGSFRGVVEGVQKAYVADLVAPELRGTAMGAFDTSVGLAMFPSSFIVGIIWASVSSAAAFAYGAALSFAATAFLLLALGGGRRRP